MICYYLGHEVPTGRFFIHGNVVFCEPCERRYAERERQAELQMKIRRDNREQDVPQTA